MKKKLSGILFLISITLLCACGNRGDEQRNNEGYEEQRIEELTSVIEETKEGMPEANMEMSEKRMTREYIIEQNLFTEEELEGVDVEAILKNHNWKEGDENRKTWKTFFLIEAEEQKIAAGIIQTVDYSYLGKLNVHEGGLSDEEFESIKTIAFQYNSGTYFETIILDKENGKMYLGEGCDLLAADVVPPVTIDMGEETWDTVMELLASCNVTEWKKRYQGTSVGTTGHFWWHLLIELKNEEKCDYSGEGVMGFSTPEKYRELEQGLKELFEAFE